MQPIKFIHMADTHLGFQQYNIPERKKDFNKAFNWVLGKAIEEKVDFILLAGDVFNSNKSDPETMTAIYQMITQFKNKSQQKLNREIPIIAIEGNHDKSNYFAKRSWMQFLADLDLIILLNPGNIKEENEEEIFHFTPYSENKKKPGMIRIKDTCIYGVPFYGAVTKKFFPIIYDSLSNTSDTYNILMMHFGITGQVKDKPGIDMSENLNQLHEKIDYLALGHFHKKYALPINNEWIFNPGSLEVNDAKEIWGIRGESYQRGIFLVEVKDKNRPNINHLLCANGNPEDSNEIPNRFFHYQWIDLGLSKQTSFNDAISFILNKLQPGLGDVTKKNLKKDNLEVPLVLLTLAGTISYSKLEVDINKLREQIQNKYNILDVRIFSGKINSKIDGLMVDPNSEKSIEDIEFDVFSLLIQENMDYASYSNEIIQLMLDLKPPLLNSKPDYNFLRDNVKDWWKANISDQVVYQETINMIESDVSQDEVNSTSIESSDISITNDNDELDLLDDGLDD